MSPGSRDSRHSIALRRAGVNGFESGRPNLPSFSGGIVPFHRHNALNVGSDACGLDHRHADIAVDEDRAQHDVMQQPAAAVEEADQQNERRQERNRHLVEHGMDCA